MIFDVENTLLLVVDIQEKLLNISCNKEEISKKSAIICKSANVLNIPVVVTEQYPQGLGATVETLKDVLSDNTVYFEKKTFSALDNQEVLETIKNTGKKQILVCGIETHICVYQTVYALIKLGYNVTVIKDCCGSRSDDERNEAFRVMQNFGAEIKTTEMVLFELLKSAKHPNFKEIQALIK